MAFMLARSVGTYVVVSDFLVMPYSRYHLETLWLVPVSLAFTGIGLLGVAVAIKLREYGTRLAALERGLQDRPGLGR